MLLRNLLLPLAGILLLASAPVFAQSVSVEVVADDGHVFPTYPADSRQPGSFRAYLEAQREARYGIRVRNNTDRRIGLVIAVDGRNIISGDKSYLGNGERMYILNPYAEETYRGWRSDRNSIQRFYFTDEGDSYAGAWGDSSAMGVVAVAVYAEQVQEIRREYSLPSSPPPSFRSAPRRRNNNMMADEAPAADAAMAPEAAAGTGYGEREGSISRRVEFKPEGQTLERHFYKYEWHESLCRKHVINCQPERPPRDNRMWDDNGYAPAPPGRERY